MKKAVNLKKGLSAKNPDDIDVFYNYISQKDYESADRMLADGLEIDKTNLVFNAIGNAAHDGDLEAIEYLIKNGANVNYPDGCGIKALSRAVGQNNYEAAELLLMAGAKPNTMDYQFCSGAFMCSVENGNKNIVELLIKYKIKINKSPELYGVALSLKQGNKELCNLLLRAGFAADFEEIGRNTFPSIEYTPLGYAALHNDLDTCKLLLEYGANSDNRPKYAHNSPVAVAIKNSHYEIAVLLLEAGKTTRTEQQVSDLMFIASRKGVSARLFEEVVKINSYKLNDHEKWAYWQFFTKNENHAALSFLADAGFLLEGEYLEKFDSITRDDTPSYYPYNSSNLARSLLGLNHI